MKLRLSVLLLILPFFQSIGICSGIGVWWNMDWESRISLTVENKTAVDFDHQVVILTGADFLKKTGTKEISTTSLRLVDAGGCEESVQVDERDGTGLFVSNPNLKIDDDDEIVFEVSVPRGGKSNYCMYFSGKPKSGAAIATDLKITPLEKNDMGQVKLSNSLVSLIIKGPRTQPDLDPTAIKAANFGCGAITSLKVKDVETVHFLAAYQQVIPQSLRNVPFSVPETVVAGPVRTIIQVIWDTHQINAPDGNVAFDGKEIRYYALYKNSGRLDFENVFLYTKFDPFSWRRAKGTSTPSIIYSLCYSAGQFGTEDTLVVPVAGDAVNIEMEKTVRKENNAQIFYNTPRPDEGWFAWVDKKKEIGLATFFTPPEAFQISILAVNNCQSLQQNLNYCISKDVAKQNNIRVKLTFFAVGKSDEVKPYYDFWINPSIFWGKEEQL